MKPTILRLSEIPAWNTQPMQQNMQGEGEQPGDETPVVKTEEVVKTTTEQTPDEKAALAKQVADLAAGKTKSDATVAKLTKDLEDAPKKFQKDMLDQLAKAFGMKSGEVTVETLQETLKTKDAELAERDKAIAERDAKLAERDRKDAIRDAITEHKGRPSLLHAVIGSGVLNSLDQTKDSFAKDVSLKVKEYIAANPEFSLAPAGGSDGSDLSGGDASRQETGDDDDIAALLEKKSKNSSRR